MPGSGFCWGKIAQIIAALSDEQGTHHDTSLDMGQVLGAIKMTRIFGDALVVYAYCLVVGDIQLM
jgi:hypothetical protein